MQFLSNIGWYVIHKLCCKRDTLLRRLLEFHFIIWGSESLGTQESSADYRLHIKSSQWNIIQSVQMDWKFSKSIIFPCGLPQFIAMSSVVSRRKRPKFKFSLPQAALKRNSKSRCADCLCDICDSYGAWFSPATAQRIVRNNIWWWVNKNRPIQNSYIESNPSG